MSEKKIKTSASTSNARASFPFEKINYQLLIASIVVVVIGFLLMMGTEDIYSFTKITLAPLVVVLGFALGFVSILYKPKSKNTDN
ncbi:DUF3098 domain-containing protein [Sphingobacterium paludis]|uniref:DUF3098 family protein n=1 Tax=Sphingobacterium paludis TaxID=1476465 RepID=A0A4R7CYK9_9SPHI|nr:DUF3098 domain-containing protein [Sphingobacterium paludis]TDS13027.1 Protein of unknown function (DUF3098) [Sphingobacterium paludis]